MSARGDRRAQGILQVAAFARGITTITVTEDEAGTTESMGRAANWVKENLPNSNLGAPQVITGQVRMNATR